MKIKNATILFVLVPFVLGTVMLIYCIWAVSTNKNYTIQETIQAGSAKLVWYTEMQKKTDVLITHVQCIGKRKIFDPHQERYDIFIAEGTPELSFALNSPASENATSITITVSWSESTSVPSLPVRIIRQKAEAHGLSFVWN